MLTYMGFWRHVACAALVWAVSALSVYANSYPVSNDPAYAGSFHFWCPPNTRTFKENFHYLPYIPEGSHAGCAFSIPSDIRAQGEVTVAVFRGSVGSSTVIGADKAPYDGTLVSLFPVVFAAFHTPLNEEEYFGLVFAQQQNQEGFYTDSQQFFDYFERGAAEGLPPPPPESYRILRWKWGPKPPEEYDPVVIIPGILGSWEKDGTWVLDPILHTYQNLVDTFLANGYTEGETLFQFGYDWRNSNVVTAHLLGQKIAEILEHCQCEHVDIIAHSMGGLVAAEHIKETERDLGGIQGIDEVAYVGVPFYGAPKAYKTWEAGEIDFGDPLQTIILRRIFTREARNNGFNSIFEYIRNKPITSVQELLPIYPNYLYAGSYEPLSYPEGYPRNIFLEDLEGAASKLFNIPRNYVFVGETGTNSTTVGFDIRPSSVLPKWEHGEPVEEHTGRGDGTVPYESAAYYWSPEPLKDVNHTELVSATASLIFKELNGKLPDIVVHRSYNVDGFDLLIEKLGPSHGDFRLYAETVGELLLKQNPLLQRVLTIVIYSPLNIEITAPDGTRVGTDPATGMVHSEIPDAQYSNAGKYEFAIIPNPPPGIYRLRAVGTGGGGYALATGLSDPATTSIAIAEGEAALGRETRYALVLASTSVQVTLTEDMASEQPLTPESCVTDVQMAYHNKWITKKSVYNGLINDCRALQVLFAARDKAKNEKAKRNAMLSIKVTLDHMDKLAKDKSNKKEAVELITKYTTWFRENEL